MWQRFIDWAGSAGVRDIYLMGGSAFGIDEITGAQSGFRRTSACKRYNFK